MRRITRHQQERRIVREMTAGQRATFHRLVAYRDGYQGNSQAEKRERRNIVTSFLVRAG